MKPIVFGNVAHYFGKKREDDGHTHQWTVYVKPYRNEVCDSTWISVCRDCIYEFIYTPYTQKY